MFGPSTDTQQTLLLFSPSRMGAGDLNFAEFSQQCDMFSGGLSIRPVVIQDNSALNSFRLEIMGSSYCLHRNVEAMLALWKDVLMR